MAAADTNVLVRLLQRDDPAQLRKAMAFLERNGRLWISGAVLTETVWVLISVYAWDKPKLLAMLQAAMESKDFAFQDQAAVQAAVRLFPKVKAGFVDCLAVELAKAHGESPLATFDKIASKLPGAVAP